MKTILITVGVIAASLLGRTSSNGAQFGSRIYSIVELTDSDVAMIDVHDGSIEDWEEVVGEPTVTALDFMTDPDLGPYDPASLDFRIWIAWHDATNHIYVAMERADNVYVNEFDRQDSHNQFMQRHDSYISFTVDGDHSGGQYIFFNDGYETNEEYWLLTNQQAQWYLAIAETYDNGPHVDLFSHTFHGDWSKVPPYAEGGGRAAGENPTITVTEFYVTPFDRFVYNSPDESVVSELSPGKIIGFAIAVADFEPEPHNYKSIHYLPMRSDPDLMLSSDNFADAVLLNSEGEIPEVSAVESITWGRIKAKFVK